ncbi:AAA family ATPase [Candidatus Dependentiae bacterium]|nr:AAA family ATPase [Candidatus Dependentiae bacterium]MCC7414794.1 AAA family ATPase [Campylobacterota bacterium]
MRATQMHILVVTLIFSTLSITAKSRTGIFFEGWTEFNRKNLNLLRPKNTKESKESALGTDKLPVARLRDIRGQLPQEIYDLCDFINNSQDFINAGATPPKGILLEGPPGTGKTSIARALAGELDVPFVSASASSFIELYVGTGPQHVRALFNNAQAALTRTGASHVIIFIDELDAIGSRTEFNAHSETKNTINELLVQMDGFSSDPRVIVIAATNNVDSIDEALKRRGRFDYIVRIPLPNETSRLDILTYYLTNARFHRSLAGDASLMQIAQQTIGFSGADLEGLADDAALEAGRNKRREICQQDLELALQKRYKNGR